MKHWPRRCLGDIDEIGSCYCGIVGLAPECTTTGCCFERSGTGAQGKGGRNECGLEPPHAHRARTAACHYLSSGDTGLNYKAKTTHSIAGSSFAVTNEFVLANFAVNNIAALPILYGRVCAQTLAHSLRTGWNVLVLIEPVAPAHNSSSAFGRLRVGCAVPVISQPWNVAGNVTDSPSGSLHKI